MDTRALIKRWWARTEAVEQAHFRRSVEFQRKHLRWGIALIVLSSLLGGLGSIAQQTELTAKAGWPDTSVKIALSVLGIIVPMLSAMVTFWRYQERGKAHHDAGARFSALKRLLQCEYATYQPDHEQELKKQLERVRKAWDQLSIDAPAIDKLDWSEIGAFDERVERLARQSATEAPARELRSVGPVSAVRA